MVEFVVKVVIAYLLGSVVGSLVLGRWRGVDIRTLGSGNAGGTNALRTQGKGFALGVVLIDVLKGWVAAGWLPSIALPFGGGPLSPSASAWLPAACALAAIVGHVYPIWHGFRGGKGAATLVGALAGLNPWLLVPLLATWFVVVMFTGYVGLASIAAAAAVPIFVVMTSRVTWVPLLVFGVVVAGFVAFTHRTNIARMRSGSEPRAMRMWLFGKRSSS